LSTGKDTMTQLFFSLTYTLAVSIYDSANQFRLALLAQETQQRRVRGAQCSPPKQNRLQILQTSIIVRAKFSARSPGETVR
jgi:hypothetical protein